MRERERESLELSLGPCVMCKSTPVSAGGHFTTAFIQWIDSAFFAYTVLTLGFLSLQTHTVGHFVHCVLFVN